MTNKIGGIDDPAGHFERAEISDADPHLPQDPQRVVERALLGSQRARRIIKTVLALGIGGGVVFVALSSAGGLSDSLHFLRKVDGRWIVVAGACELSVYIILSMHLRFLAGPHPTPAGWPPSAFP